MTDFDLDQLIAATPFESEPETRFGGRATRNFGQEHAIEGCHPNSAGYCSCPLELAPEETAALVCSDAGYMHKPVIDFDLPVQLVPSGTPGHSHLYIDQLVSFDHYVAILQALCDAGIVEYGFLNATEERGYGSVRHPDRPKATGTAVTAAERSAYGDTMADFTVRQRAADALLEATVVEREAYARLDDLDNYVTHYYAWTEVKDQRDRLADAYLAALHSTTKLDEPVPYVVADPLPTPPALAEFIASGSPITAADIDDEPDYEAITEAGEYNRASGTYHCGPASFYAEF